MRRAILTAVVLALLAVGSIAKEERLAPGKVVSRNTKGGVPYAVYVPKGWRKGRALPLLVHVPTPHKLPFEWLSGRTRNDVWATSGAKVFQCAVLLECHNREDAHLKRRIDVPRYLELMDRDAVVLRGVLEEIFSVLPIRREAVLVTATGFASEAALGVAVRCPEHITAALLTERCNATLGTREGSVDWGILEPREETPKAAGLHVYFPHVTYDHDVVACVKASHKMRAALLHYGYRHVHFCGVGPDDTVVEGGPEQARKLFLEHAEVRAVQVAHAKERDKMLSDGRRHLDRGSLSSALKSYRHARDLEAKHELAMKSGVLWESLESRGREMLAEAGALAEPKRRAAYRKVGRLFKGTPLAEEVQALIGGAK